MTSLLPLAITLGLLIAGGAAWFAALVVTRNAFEWILSSGHLKRLPMLQLINQPNIDFHYCFNPTEAIQVAAQIK